MERVKIYTNYLDENDEKKIMDALNSGKAVNVGSACIGHTRAAMVEMQAIQFLESVGAKSVDVDEWGNEFHAYYKLA